MAMKLFNKTKDNVFHLITKKDFHVEKLEKTLEDWLQSNPHLLGDDILLIGRQVRTGHGIIDLLAIDSQGNIVVIELKRGRATREVVAQLNSYLTIADAWTESDLIRNANLIRYDRETNNLIKKFKEHFKCAAVPDFNRKQIGVVVAEEYEQDFVPQIRGLRFSCRVLQFSNFTDKAEEEYLLVNTLHDSAKDIGSDATTAKTEYESVPEETRERFYDLADSVHNSLRTDYCRGDDGWRLHKSRSFVQVVFSCWKLDFEGISLYYEPETGKYRVASNCLPKHNRLLSAKLKRDKAEIEERLGKHIKWDFSSWECVSEDIGGDCSKISGRIKTYIKVLKPYFDEVLLKPKRLNNMRDRIADANATTPVKIGEYVQFRLAELFKHGRLNSHETEKLQDMDYSRKTFALSLPLLRKVELGRRDKNGDARYWITKFGNNRFYVCSQWYERQREKFEVWLNGLPN